MNKKNLKPNEGFTLVEMLIVFTIIGIMTGAIALNIRSGERQYALQRSAQIVTQAVNEAIVMSLGNKEHYGGIHPGGFGIMLSKAKPKMTTIFVDCNEDNAYSSGNTLCGKTNPGPPPGELVKEIDLERDIEIEEIEAICASGSCDNPNCPASCSVHIIFQPPEPNVGIYKTIGGGSPGTFHDDTDPANYTREVIVTLGDGRGNQVSVFINNLGVTRIE